MAQTFKRWLVVRSNGDAKVYTRRHFPAWNEAVIPLVVTVPAGVTFPAMEIELPDTSLTVSEAVE